MADIMKFKNQLYVIVRQSHVPCSVRRCQQTGGGGPRWSTALRQSQTYKAQGDSRPRISHYSFATLDWRLKFCKAVVRTRYNIRVFIVSTTKYVCINPKGRLIFYHFSQRRQPYHSDCELHSQGVLNEEEDSYKHLSRLVKDKSLTSTTSSDFELSCCWICCWDMFVFLMSLLMLLGCEFVQLFSHNLRLQL